MAAAAWRPHAALAAAVLAAPLVAGRRTRRAGLVTVGLAASALVPAVRRTVGRPVPGPAGLTVLSANVLAGRADTGALAALIARERPDLVVLPEAGHDFAAKLVPLLDGYRYWSSTPVGQPDGPSVVLLAADPEVAATPLAGVRGLRATGGPLAGRALYAVHPEAPMGARLTGRWLAEMAHLRRWGAEGSLIAGDLNATLDHRELRTGLRDAGALAGRGLVGTFPARLPRALGIPIDHVLVPRGTAVTRYEIVDLPGTDHRAVLAGLRVPVTDRGRRHPPAGPVEGAPIRRRRPERPSR
ncbi:hypothetical protein GCM10009836_46580 [Pseudonocardia ailaonensis]|uniref:Endonuclease/exonuclease/phosphatase domain-containing protein n=1 Tax=Pseudonocardia ailaonensis TaxID=367279 RepID=A0ABN2NAY4_9PSEU